MEQTTEPSYAPYLEAFEAFCRDILGLVGITVKPMEVFLLVLVLLSGLFIWGMMRGYKESQKRNVQGILYRPQTRYRLILYPVAAAFMLAVFQYQFNQAPFAPLHVVFWLIFVILAMLAAWGGNGLSLKAGDERPR